MLNQFSYSHNIYSIICLLHGTDKREYEERKKQAERIGIQRKEELNIFANNNIKIRKSEKKILK